LYSKFTVKFAADFESDLTYGRICKKRCLSQSSDCETEGVTYVYRITPPATIANEGNNISLPTTYTVTVYAKKDGFLNSDTVTEEVELQGVSVDLNGDGVVDTQDVLKIYKYIQEH